MEKLIDSAAAYKTCVYGYFPDYHEFRDIYSWNREILAWFKYWVLEQ